MTDFASLFKNADAESKKAGDRLLQEGAYSSTMYVLRSGNVEIRVGGVVVEHVAAGGLVGEMGLVDDAPCSADAVAVTDCEVIAIDQKRFLFLVQETPFFALEVMRTMARRLRAMNRRV
jgi:CRP/FNR family transcriptional regulator, cyclic AMP receptor protein